jgi:8-oxo-dGTP pyrophosphatase MutT (NUDIX family)
MGYIDFVRGKYDKIKDNNNTNTKINICLNEMTFQEKQNLLTKDFDTIWSELWVNHESKCFKNEYENAKKKFNNLDIKTLVNNSTNSYFFQEFGFAKGRRNMREKNLECAEREFYEETGYNKNSYDLIKNYPTITEEFTGTNNIAYRHIYYLVKMKDNILPPKIDLNNKIQTGEVKNIGWFTLNECLTLIRPYDNEKKNVITSVHSNIKKFNTYDKSNLYLNTYKKYSQTQNFLIDTF